MEDEYLYGVKVQKFAYVVSGRSLKKAARKAHPEKVKVSARSIAGREFKSIFKPVEGKVALTKAHILLNQKGYTPYSLLYRRAVNAKAPLKMSYGELKAYIISHYDLPCPNCENGLISHGQFMVDPKQGGELSHENIYFLCYDCYHEKES